MWMNDFEVENAEYDFRDHPTMGPACRTLNNLRNVVNVSSDGWPYWRKPSQAADKLMTLIQQAEQHERESFRRPQVEMPTVEQIKKAYTPIKAFCTRYAGVLNGTVTFETPESVGTADAEPVSSWRRI